MLLAAACSAPQASGRAPSPAASVPDARLSTLDGAPMELGQFLGGRPALVSFWATWCEACVTEMPALNRLSAEASAEGDAVVVGVAIGEPEAKVAGFVRAHHLQFAQLVDEDFRFTDAVGERRVPTTLVVDRSRDIVFRGGALDAEGLDAFRRATKRK